MNIQFWKNLPDGMISEVLGDLHSDFKQGALVFRRRTRRHYYYSIDQLVEHTIVGYLKEFVGGHAQADVSRVARLLLKGFDGHNGSPEDYSVAITSRENNLGRVDN